MAIGKAVPMLDAIERVTGSVPYAVNLKLPDMLTARVLRSPLPHALIEHVDTSAAEALPGVVAIVTAADFEQSGLNPVYGSGNDQVVVARNKVRYVGDAVAVVAAETAEIAEAALALIQAEYEELPAVFDELEAIKDNAPLLHTSHPANILTHAKLRHGDIEAGFASADEIIEETYTSPVAQQTSLEPQVAVAQWQDEMLSVWTSSQAPFTVRRELAGILNIDPEQVRIIIPPVGGGFGGKGNVRTQPLAAVLAWKVGGRPVKLLNSRSDEFVTVTKHAASITIKTGVKRDGTLTARQVTLHWNAGAYASSSKHLVPAGMFRAVGPYRIPAVHVDSYGIYTNLPPAAAYRGAMSSQATWAHESHMDSIAHQLGIDPLELRRRNLLQTDDEFATGEKLHEAFFVECLDEAARQLDWERPLDKQPTARTRRGRGMGVMMKHTIANSKSECRLVLHSDGWVKLYTSTVEMGQGSHTALAQICAQALSVPLNAISIVGPDTAQTPYDAQTASSRATFMMGNAIMTGADTLKTQLLDAAVPLLETPPDRLLVKDGHIHSATEPDISISYAEVLQRNNLETMEAHGIFRTNEGKIDPETGQGIAAPHWHQGAGACEVEVALDTGKVTILRYHSAAFAGTIINPNFASLQNDGNVIYALGHTFMEEMVFDGGQLINGNLADYLIPSMLDTPRELNNTSLESANSTIHGLGEMTLPPVSPAIANAIFDATGVRIYDLPITPEKVYKALNHDHSK